MYTCFERFRSVTNSYESVMNPWLLFIHWHGIRVPDEVVVQKLS